MKEILIILLFSRSCLILQLLGRSPVSLPTRQSGQDAALFLKIYLFIFSNSWCACVCGGGCPSCPCFIALLPRSLETASLAELELCLWSASLRYPPVFIPHNAGITGTYNHTVLFTRMLRIWTQVPYACVPSAVCWPIFPASSYWWLVYPPSTACF